MRITRWEPSRELEPVLRRHRPALPRAGRRHLLIESAYGSFSRSSVLPEDADGIRAECRDGVLGVHIPKRPDEQPRQISIDVQ